MIHMHCIERKWNTIFSVFDDYVITISPDKLLLKKMDLLFQSHSEDAICKSMGELYVEKGSFKIVVEKNEKKARKIEKEFKKYFQLK